MYTNLFLLSADVHRHCLWPHCCSCRCRCYTSCDLCWVAGNQWTSGSLDSTPPLPHPPPSLHPRVWRQNTEHMAAAAAVVTILSESGQGGTCAAAPVSSWRGDAGAGAGATLTGDHSTTLATLSGNIRNILRCCAGPAARLGWARWRPEGQCQRGGRGPGAVQRRWKPLSSILWSSPSTRIALTGVSQHGP